MSADTEAKQARGLSGLLAASLDDLAGRVNDEQLRQEIFKRLKSRATILSELIEHDE